MNENKPNMPSGWIDPDDAPELDDDFLMPPMSIGVKC